jgi:hypothetical protein
LALDYTILGHNVGVEKLATNRTTGARAVRGIEWAVEDFRANKRARVWRWMNGGACQERWNVEPFRGSECTVRVAIVSSDHSVGTIRGAGSNRASRERTLDRGSGSTDLLLEVDLERRALVNAVTNCGANTAIIFVKCRIAEKSIS